jgi:hypothetical protein
LPSGPPPLPLPAAAAATALPEGAPPLLPRCRKWREVACGQPGLPGLLATAKPANAPKPPPSPCSPADRFINPTPTTASIATPAKHYGEGRTSRRSHFGVQPQQQIQLWTGAWPTAGFWLQASLLVCPGHCGAGRGPRAAESRQACTSTACGRTCPVRVTTCVVPPVALFPAGVAGQDLVGGLVAPQHPLPPRGCRAARATKGPRPGNPHSQFRWARGALTGRAGPPARAAAV